jgi:hypothetical protein
VSEPDKTINSPLLPIKLSTDCFLLFYCASNRSLKIFDSKLETGRDWKPFLRNGLYLAANSYLASVSQFINPIL